MNKEPEEIEDIANKKYFVEQCAPLQSKLQALEAELKTAELISKQELHQDLKAALAENKDLKENRDMYKLANELLITEKRDLQAQLDKYRWIPAIKPPENLRDKPTEAAWKIYYYTLDYEDVIPRVMTAEQIFLNESSEVEYYMPIILPESEGKK